MVKIVNNTETLIMEEEKSKTEVQGTSPEIVNERVAPEDWTKVPTLLELKQDLTDALPSHDIHKGRVSVWLDNLNVTGTALAKTPKGSSKIVPKLIRKQAEWRYAALSEPFLSTRDLYKVEPVTWEDKESSIQNGLILNNQINTKIDKVAFIDEYVRTAVDEGTVIVRVGWDFIEKTEIENVPVITFTPDPEMGPMHEHIMQLMQESPSQYQTDVPDELKEAHELTMETGTPYRAEITGYEQEEVITTLRNCPTLEVCDYRNVIIDPSCKGDLEKARFIVYTFETSKSELKRDGKYKNLDNVLIANANPLSTPDHEQTGDPNFNFNDDARKIFVVHEYWGFQDVDGSGLVKPIVCAWAGNTIIRMGDNPFPDQKLPFVKVQYLPVRRGIHGQPDGHLLEDNQKIIGAVTRGMIDIMGKSANAQTGTRKGMLDGVNRSKHEKGLNYEYNGNIDPRIGFHMHTYPEIPQSAPFMVQLQNNDAESLTGVRAFSNGISGDGLGETATGVRGALDAASKRELGILRRLANGMVQIGRKIISMNSEFLNEEEVVRVTNKEFVTVRRDDLAGDIDLSLAITTAEEDNAKAQELAFMLQTIGPEEDPGMRKLILSEIARLRKMPDLAHKFETFEPKPDPLAERIKELEILKLEAELGLINSETEENNAEAMLDRARALVEEVRAGNMQSDTDQKNLDFVEQEGGVTQERELQKQGEQARANMQLKQLDYQLKAMSEKSVKAKEKGKK